MHHTPGPWKAHTLPNGSHHIIADHWNASIATTMYPDSGSEGREANARLIAAAPDLLAALKAIHACHRAFSNTENWTALDDEARSAAESAINKATVE